MAVRPDQLVYRAGGAALARYGTLRKRTANFEEIIETYARASTAAVFDREGVLRLVQSNAVRVSFLDLDGDGVRETVSVPMEGALVQLVEHAIPGGSEASFETVELDGVTNLSGEYGGRIEDGDVLQYAMPSNFDPDSWTVSIWMIPDFDSTDGQEHDILNVIGDGSYSHRAINVYKRSSGELTVTVGVGGTYWNVTAAKTFSAGVPLFIGARLHARTLSLFVDIDGDNNLTDNIGKTHGVARATASSWSALVGMFNTGAAYAADGTMNVLVTSHGRSSQPILDRYNGANGGAFAGAASRWLGKYGEDLAFYFGATSSAIEAYGYAGATNMLAGATEGRYDFDPTTDYIDIANTSDFNGATKVSFMWEIELDATGSDQPIFSSDTSGATNPASSIGVTIHTTGGVTKFYTYFDGGSTAIWQTHSIGGGGLTFPSGQRFMLGVAVDLSLSGTDRVKYYIANYDEATRRYGVWQTVNGSKGVGGTPPASLTTETGNHRIGGTTFDGKIDDFRWKIGMAHDFTSIKPTVHEAPVAYWDRWFPFDGDANDDIGSATGTVTGATLVSDGRHEYGRFERYDANGALAIRSADNVNFGAWTGLDGAKSFTAAVTFTAFDLSDEGWRFWDSGSGKSFWLRRYTTGQFYVHFDNASITGYTASSVITSGVETMLVVVFDGDGDVNTDRLKVFRVERDAESGIWGAPTELTLTFTGTMPTLVPVRTGNVLLSSGSKADNVDDVRVWVNRKLTSTEIGYLDPSDERDGGLFSAAPIPDYWWTFSEGSGSSARDREWNASNIGTMARPTFSRADTGTQVTGDGVVRSVASGELRNKHLVGLQGVAVNRGAFRFDGTDDGIDFGTFTALYEATTFAFYGAFTYTGDDGAIASQWGSSNTTKVWLLEVGSGKLVMTIVRPSTPANWGKGTGSTTLVSGTKYQFWVRYDGNAATNAKKLRIGLSSYNPATDTWSAFAEETVTFGGTGYTGFGEMTYVWRNTAPANLWLGRDSSNTYPLRGTIDDFRIWSNKLPTTTQLGTLAPTDEADSMVASGAPLPDHWWTLDGRADRNYRGTVLSAITRPTFSRADTGTQIGPDGVVRAVASGELRNKHVGGVGPSGQGAYYFDGSGDYIGYGAVSSFEAATKATFFFVTNSFNPTGTETIVGSWEQFDNTQRNFEIRWDNGGNLMVELATDDAGSRWFGITTSAPTRDGSTTYAYFVVVDLTQGTDANRLKIYEAVVDEYGAIGTWSQKTLSFTGTAPASFHTPSGGTPTFMVGAESLGNYSLTGTIDDLRFIVGTAHSTTVRDAQSLYTTPELEATAANWTTWLPMNGDANDRIGSLAGTVTGAIQVSDGRRPIVALSDRARTNLVTSQTAASGWTETAPANLTYTTGQSDPEGGTGAELWEDSASTNAFWTAVTFTGDGTKSASVCLKQQANGYVNAIAIYDSTATAFRHKVRVTWKNGAPVVTTTSGSGLIFRSKQLSGGWWLIRFSATSVVAANSNRLYLYPADVSAGQGMYVFRPMTFDAVFPPDALLTASEATTLDSTTVPLLNATPQALTLYWDGVVYDLPNYGTNRYLFNLGDGGAGASTRGLGAYLSNSSQELVGYFGDGSTLFQQPISVSTLKYGDRVEVRIDLQSNGDFTVGVSINGGTESTATNTTPTALPGAWDYAVARFGMGASGASATASSAGTIALKATTGSKTRAEMRALNQPAIANFHVSDQIADVTGSPSGATSVTDGRRTRYPVTLLERAYTNKRSAAFGSWTTSNATLTSTTSADPSGGTGAAEITASAGTGEHGIHTSPTTAIGSVSGDVWLKAGTHRYARYWFYNGTDGSLAYASVDLLTGRVIASAGTVKVTLHGEWVRVRMAGAQTVANSNTYVRLTDSAGAASWTAAGTETIYVWNPTIYESSTAPESTLAASEATTAEELTVALKLTTPQEATYLYEGVVLTLPNTGPDFYPFNVGSAGASSANKVLACWFSGTAATLYVQYGNGTDLRTMQWAGLSLQRYDHVAIRVYQAASGALTGGLSINGAAEITSSGSGTSALPGTWQNNTVRFGGNTGVTGADLGIISFRAQSGSEKSLAQMRALAQPDIAHYETGNATADVDGTITTAIRVPDGRFPIGSLSQIERVARAKYGAKKTFYRGMPGWYYDADSVLLRKAYEGVLRDRSYVTARNATQYRTTLTEPARTNLATYSEDLSSWGSEALNSTVTSNANVSPMNDLTADAFVETADTGSHYRRQAVAGGLSATTTYVYSHYVKRGNRSWVALFSRDKAGVEGWSYFDIENGALGTKHANHSNYGMESLGGDWYRVWIAFSSGSGAEGGKYGIYSATGDTVASFAGSTAAPAFYTWGAQIEAGYAPSSYIPTTTASSTRTADTFTDSYTASPQQAATFFYEGVVTDLPNTGSTKWLFNVGNATGAYLGAYYTSGANSITCYWFDGSTSRSAALAVSLVVGDYLTVRLYRAADGTMACGVSVNGAAETTATNANTLTIPSTWGSNVVSYTVSGAQAQNALISMRVASGSEKTRAQMLALIESDAETLYYYAPGQYADEGTFGILLENTGSTGQWYRSMTTTTGRFSFASISARGYRYDAGSAYFRSQFGGTLVSALAENTRVRTNHSYRESSGSSRSVAAEVQTTAVGYFDDVRWYELPPLTPTTATKGSAKPGLAGFGNAIGAANSSVVDWDSEAASDPDVFDTAMASAGYQRVVKFDTGPSGTLVRRYRFGLAGQLNGLTPGSWYSMTVGVMIRTGGAVTPANVTLKATDNVGTTTGTSMTAKGRWQWLYVQRQFDGAATEAYFDLCVEDGVSFGTANAYVYVAMPTIVAGRVRPLPIPNDAEGTASKATETNYDTFVVPPNQEITWYLKFVENGETFPSSNGVLSWIGDRDGASQSLRFVTSSANRYQFIYYDDTGSNTVNLNPSVSLGDVVELRLHFDPATQTVTAGVSVNGGAETTGTVTGTRTLPTAWGALHVEKAPTIGFDWLDEKIALGEHDLTAMREAA